MPGPILNKNRLILVVDDDPDSTRIVLRALEHEGYRVEAASSGQEALELLKTFSPHLVLMDVSMPGLNGLETLRSLRKKHQYVSTIFVSGKNQTEDVIRGLDAGADDYICKPFDTRELLARVRCLLRVKDLNDQLTQANQKLKKLVDTDDLTGLFNMRSLYKKLDYEIDRARRYRGAICVMMIDMDHFKAVNDSHDHLFGSFVLSEVGRIIKENIRKIDFAARYGGDEFLVVLSEIDKSGAEHFAERLRQCIEKHVFKSKEHQTSLTLSMGYALVEPFRSDVDARTLVRHADRALYRAKERGRNRVEATELHMDSMQVTHVGLKSLRR